MMNTKDKQSLRQWEKYRQSLSKQNSINMDESAAEKQARIKLLLSDYGLFINYYLLHYARSPLAKFHKDFTGFVAKHNDCFVGIEWARDHAKSITACLGLLLWLAMRGNIKNAIVVSKSEDNAIELLDPLRKELESNERIINDFGDQKPVIGDWSEDAFCTRGGINFSACGRGQSPRGTRKGADRPDIIIIDDIDDDELVLNKSRVDKVWDWVLQALIPTQSIAGGRFIAVQNKYADDCIIARIMQRAVELKKNGYKGAYTNKVNIIDSEGQPSWKERFTLPQCEAMINKIGYIAAQREYFNNPIRSGKHYNPNWIQYKKLPNLNTYQLLISYCDPSFSNNGDSKATVLIGYSKGEYHIHKVYCDKASISTMIGWHYEIDTILNKNGLLPKQYMEDVFFQKQNMDSYYREYATNHNLPNLPILSDKRRKPDKVSRLLGLTALFEAGLVYFNEAEKDNRHTINLVNQFLSFDPPKKTLVDGIDAVEGGIYLLKNSIVDYGQAISVTQRKRGNKHF